MAMLEVDPNLSTRASTTVWMEQGSEGTPGRPKGVQVLNARSGLNIDNIV
jgi:hypothetical protein